MMHIGGGPLQFFREFDTLNWCADERCFQLPLLPAVIDGR